MLVILASSITVKLKHSSLEQASIEVVSSCRNYILQKNTNERIDVIVYRLAVIYLGLSETLLLVYGTMHYFLVVERHSVYR